MSRGHLSRYWSSLGLEGRAVLATGLLLAFVIVSMTGYGQAQGRRWLLESAAGRLESIARSITRECAFPLLAGNRAGLDDLLRKTAEREPIAYALIEDASGQVLASRRGAEYLGPVPRDASEIVELPERVLESVRGVQTSSPSASAEKLLIGSAPGRPTWLAGRLRLGLDIQSELTKMAELARQLAVGGGTLLIAVFLATGVLMRRITEPLRRMAELAEKVASGDLSRSVSERWAGEVGQLADSLNHMVRSLATSREQLAEVHQRLEERVHERTRELEVARDFTTRVLTQVPIAVAVTSGTLRLRSANRAWERLFGQAEGVLFEELAGELQPPAEEVRRWLLLRTGEENDLPLELTWLCPAGPCILEVRGARYEQESEMFLVVTMQDVSQQRQLQQQMNQAARLAAVGELAAGVAHEINNPVDGILGMSALLRRRVAIAPEPAGWLDAIDECARRVAAITRNLLLFSRQEPAALVPQDIVEGLRIGLSLVQRGLEVRSGVEVAWRIAASIPPVAARGNQLEQVWVNLFNNARQAMEDLPPGLPRRMTIDVAASPDAAWVEVRVRDTGPGVPQAIRSRIFEPFFTTKGRLAGTGLGLSISYGIVRDHGGEIRVSSEPGEGAAFIVRLPAAGELEPAAR